MKWTKRVAIAGALAGVALAIYGYREFAHLPGDQEIRATLAAHPDPHGRATWVPLTAISPKLQAAVVDWEDPTFYSHDGFVPEAIWLAAVADIRSLKYERGGSTITQQLAKNVFLTPEKSLTRKLREAVLTRRIERVESKAEILEVYLNVAEWGDGFAGAEQASQVYFGKSASALSWDEAALLAGMLQNPHLYNPLKDPEGAHRRRDVVLKVMLDDGDITPQEYADAIAAPCCGKTASYSAKAQ